MTPSTDIDIVDDIETVEQRQPGNPAGINIRYTPPIVKKSNETVAQFARNGSDPKENIKKFY